MPDPGPDGDPNSTDSGAEDVEDAFLEGDRVLEVGGARAALGYPVFRRIYLSALTSNIGSWMQTVVLAAFVFNITGSSTDVGLMTLAQLGPLFLLSPIGGMAADRFDRRTLLDRGDGGTDAGGADHRPVDRCP